MDNNNASHNPQNGSFNTEIQNFLNDLHSGDVEKFNLAMLTLRSMDHLSAQEAILEIKAFLSHPDPERRCDAIELLLLIAPQNTLDLVLPLLNDPIDFVRNCVCQELEFNEYYDKRTVESLINCLLRDPYHDVRYRAAVLLGKIGDDRAKPALEWAAANDTGENYEGDLVSARANWALKELKRQEF